MLLLRPPPVEAPDQLWQVWRQNLKGGSAFERYQGLSYPGYVHFRDHNQSFATLAAFDPETPFVSWNRDGIGQSIQCQFVSGNFFDVCGIGTTLGRLFGPQEDRQPGADPVAVVSHTFWKNSLGSDPQIVGRRADDQWNQPDGGGRRARRVHWFVGGDVAGSVGALHDGTGGPARSGMAHPHRGASRISGWAA